LKRSRIRIKIKSRIRSKDRRPAVDREIVTNEATDARENTTNEPTHDGQNVTNEPTAHPENVTNEATVVCGFGMNEPTLSADVGLESPTYRRELANLGLRVGFADLKSAVGRVSILPEGMPESVGAPLAPDYWRGTRRLTTMNTSDRASASIA
jgi:hypothetical protein